MKKITLLMLLLCDINAFAQDKEEFKFKNGITAYVVKGSNGWGIEDSSGKEIVPKIYGEFTHGGNLVLCKKRNDGNKYCALYDYSGKCIISEDERYSNFYFTESNGNTIVTSFSTQSPDIVLDENGNFKYKYKTLTSPEGFRYLINELTDTIVIPSGKYTGPFIIQSDIIITKIGNKTGIANLDGTTVIPANMFGRIIPDYGKGFIVKLSGYGEKGYCGYYDRDGKCIIPPNKYSEVYSLRNGVFQVCLNDKAEIVDSMGNVKFTTKYRGLGIDKDEKGNWYYISYLGNSKGKLSTTGKVIEEVKPTLVQEEINKKGFKYMEIRDVNGLYGARSMDGKVILPNEYDAIMYDHYMKNAFLLEKNGFQGWADSLGHIIIPCNKYDCIINMNTKPYVKVGINGKYGLCDNRGHEIIKPLYDDIRVSEGTFIAKMGIMEGVVDSTGNLLVPFEYTKIKPETTSLFTNKISISDPKGNTQKTGNYEVTLFNKKGVCDKQGKIIVPPHYEKLLLTYAYSYDNNTKFYHYLVQDGKTSGFFSTDGKMLFPTGLFENVNLKTRRNPNTNQLEWVISASNKSNDKIFLYDLNGNLILSITPPEKQLQEVFSNGLYEYKAGNYKKAIDFFTIALEIKQDAALYFNIGASYYHLGKYKDCIKQLNVCLGMNPTPGLRDKASNLIIDCEECLQQKRERRANFWLGVLGTAFNVASTVIQTNNALQAYNSTPQYSANNNGGFKRDTRYDYLLDPRYAMMQVQKQNWNEYLQMTNGGQTMTYEEWFAIKAQAWAESQKSESGSYSSASSSSSYSNTNTTSSSNGRDCRLCLGTGKCNTCNGKGWFTALGIGTGEHPCPNCQSNHNGRCSSCGGTGKQ